MLGVVATLRVKPGMGEDRDGRPEVLRLREVE
jgi:hypothetical protein